jgi:hypothetical protein
MKEIREKRVWNMEYRGIQIEAQKFSIGEYKPECWTFYLYIALDCLPESVREKFWLKPIRYEKWRIHYDYWAEPLISDLEWHSGCTWYSKECGFDDSPRSIKIGCDYQHYWDEGHSYDESIVLGDAKACVDSLHELIPDIKIRCPWNGSWFKKEDGVKIGEVLYSPMGATQRTEYDAEQAEKQRVKP